MSLRAVTAATIAVLVGMLGALSSASPPAATAAPAPPASPSPTAAGPDRPFRTAPAPQRLRRGGPIGAGKLKRKLKHLARKAPGASGYYVYEDRRARRNRVLFDRNGGHSRKLASNEKLFTTMTAMHRLGPNSRILDPGQGERQGRSQGKARAATSTWSAPATRRSAARGVDDLAKQVRKAGIRRITGLGDRRRQRLRPPPRRARHQLRRPRPYIAPLSGLDLRRLDLRRRSGQGGGPRRSAAAPRRRRPGRRQGQGRPDARQARARNEDALAAYESPKISRPRPRDEQGLDQLLRRDAPEAPLGEPGRKGTTNGGVKAVERFARQFGSKVQARDGSGLTDEQQGLAPQRRPAADRRPARPRARQAALQVAGDRRQGRHARPPDGRLGAAGRCRGKTGTHEPASRTSPATARPKHGLVAFSLLMNGVSSSTRPQHPGQDGHPDRPAALSRGHGQPTRLAQRRPRR